MAWPFNPGGAFNSNLNLNTSWFNVVSFGAIGDSASHPLSGIYGTLAAAQIAYPFATALTNEINWCAFQAAINACDKGSGTVFVPYGTYIMDNSSSALDGSGTLRLMDYSDATLSLHPVSILGQYNSSVLSWPADLGLNVTVTFTGALAAGTGAQANYSVLTASSVTGSLVPGQYIGGTSVHVWTRIVQQLTGTANGAGTYLCTQSQTVGSEAMSGRFSCSANPYGRRMGMYFGNYADAFSSAYGYMQEIVCNGPGAGTTLGSSACNMMGIGTGDRRILDRVSVGGFWAGINMQGGQTTWKDVTAGVGQVTAANFVGLFFQDQGNEFGDMHFDHLAAGQNLLAGIACSPVKSVVTTAFTKCTFDAQPYAFYKFPWSPDWVTALGFGPTSSFNTGALAYDCHFTECQWENIGNAAFGDGLFVTPNFSGSISGTALTTTGSPTLQVGQQLIQVSGGPAIAADTFITAIGGANSFTVSVSQTVATGQIGAQSTSFIFNTKFTHCQMGWWQSGGAPQADVQISTLPASGLLQLGSCFGVIIEDPTSSFQWAPGSDAIFAIQSMAGAVASDKPQIGFKITGDIGQLIANCQAAALGGSGFFSNSANISPGFVEIDTLGGWKGTSTSTFGAGSIPNGSVLLRTVATPGTNQLCAGAATEIILGVLVYPAQWGLVAYQGEVQAACGSNSISIGQAVYTAAGGIVTATPGGRFIGGCVTASSGGLVGVRLQGLV